jgi:cytoskeleton protein RodZ
MNSEWAEPPKDQGSNLATPGVQLAAAREAAGWTIEQIADQLKLAPRQVIALEKGDYASLPNMAVVRGFVRAYAKVLKIDATPLVAMIEVISPTSHEAAPPRRERSPTFSESRFPTLTERSSKPAGWMLGAAVAVVVVAAGAYAYHAGLIAPGMLGQGKDGAAASAPAVTEKAADTVAPIETTLVKPGQETAPIQSPSVPLISVPPQGGAPAAGSPGAGAAPAAGTAPAPVTPPVAAAPVAAVAPAAPAPAAVAAPAPAAAGASALVLKVNQDSWIEIRRPGKSPLISRLVKAGTTETFDIADPALLIVGKPAGVEATLGGAPLALPPVAGGMISRVNIK